MTDRSLDALREPLPPFLLPLEEGSRPFGRWCRQVRGPSCFWAHSGDVARTGAVQGTRPSCVPRVSLQRHGVLLGRVCGSGCQAPWRGTSRAGGSRGQRRALCHTSSPSVPKCVLLRKRTLLGALPSPGKQPPASPRWGLPGCWAQCKMKTLGLCSKSRKKSALRGAKT